MNITIDLSDFAIHGRSQLIDILTAWNSHGGIDGFILDGVYPIFNRNTGQVFLTNNFSQRATMKGNRLEIFCECSECGREDFADECKLNDQGQCNECTAGCGG